MNFNAQRATFRPRLNYLLCGLTGIVYAFSVHAKSVVTVDKTVGNVGTYSSLALDESGHPVISYSDETNGDLKLARCNDANCSGEDKSIVVVDATGGMHSSLALNALGFPVISYHDEQNGDLKLARCNERNCHGGDESIEVIDSLWDIGEYTSLKLDASDNPVISYYDRTNGDLKLAHCNDPRCVGGDESVVTLDSNGDVGEFSSLALDAAGNPVISYYDRTNGDLKLAHCNDANCTGGDETIATVDKNGDVGEYSSLALAPSGEPVISYYDSTNGDLKLVRCNDALCTGKTETTVAYDGDVGAYSSLALNTAGHPVISFYDDTLGNLRLARCTDPYCYTGDLNVVDTTKGIYGSLKLDSLNNPAISYHDENDQNLKLARCDTPYCTIANAPPIADAGGPYQGSEGQSIVLDGSGSHDPDGNMLTFSWTVDSPLCFFDDGTIATPKLTCSDDGIFTVNLMVNDGHVMSPSSNAHVTVSNENPECKTISLDADKINVGDTVTAVATATDPGSHDVLKATWTFGDGQSVVVNHATSPITQSHQYIALGTYPFTLRVEDDDGGSCEIASSVTVGQERKRQRDDDDETMRSKRNR